MELALLWQAEEDAKCGGCGEPLDESTAKENEKYYAATEVMCFGCAAINRRAEKAEKDKIPSAGLRFLLSKE